LLTSKLIGRTFRAGLVLATPCIALACSSDPSPPADPTGVGGTGGSGATSGGSGGATAGSGGSVGGALGGGGGGAGGSGGTTSGGATSGGGPPMAGSGGSLPSAGSGGVAGSAGMPPPGGTAGTSASDAGTAGVGGAMSGSAGSAGAMGGSGGAPTTTCPASASFCADFEGAGIPTGASYQPTYQAAMWADFVAFDGTQKYAGNQALMVKPTGSNGYSYRILSVPAPAPSFWARLYVRSDVDLGQADHNAFFGASTGSGDQNDGEIMEVAEQYCQVVMNLKDDVVLSVGGMAACGSGGKLLVKDTWHCMEAFFDGPNGKVQVFSDNMPIIDKTGWTAKTFQSFVFGFIGFHGPSRTMWYDDVAVSTTRVGCP
jgi:hypothetical protein